MIKHILQTLIISIVLYYSFIDVVPVFYWVLTGGYILGGLVACLFAYGLDTRAGWIQPKEVHKLKANLDSPTKIIFSALKIIIITLVLIYTENYYHLLYPLILVGFWSSISNYEN